MTGQETEQFEKNIVISEQLSRWQTASVEQKAALPSNNLQLWSCMKGFSSVLLQGIGF